MRSIIAGGRDITDYASVTSSSVTLYGECASAAGTVSVTAVHQGMNGGRQGNGHDGFERQWRSIRVVTSNPIAEQLKNRVSAMAQTNEAIYTFWDYFRNSYARNAGIRIDHFLLNAPAAKMLNAGGEKTSDHAPTWVKLAHKPKPAGP